MAHPQRFDPDDPILARVRELALALPGAAERVSHGRPNFYVERTFVTYGGTVRGSSDDSETGRSILTRPDADDRLAWLEDERFFVPAYVGPSGWIGMRLDVPDVDWAIAAELIEGSYRNTAPARRLQELDARGGADGEAYSTS